MTVKTTSSKSGPYLGDGVQTVFPYDYLTYDETYLDVIRTEAGVDTLLTLGDDYTVDGVGNENGGNVTTLVAPTATQTITIVRTVPILQNTRFSNQGGWFPQVHERSFDELTMMQQQTNLRRELAIAAPVTDPQGLNYTLPPVEAREGLAVTFDAQGNVTVSDLQGPPGPEGPATTQVSANDTTPDYLQAKLKVAGDLALAIINEGANEHIEISFTETPQVPVVAVSANDTTPDYLENKIVGLGAATVSVINEGAAEQVQVSVPVVAETPNDERVAAWVSINGNNGNINDSHGVQSVSRNSGGDYTITFDFTFATTGYAFGHALTETDGGQRIPSLEIITKTTTTLRVRTFNNSGSQTDVNELTIIVAGDY